MRVCPPSRDEVASAIDRQIGVLQMLGPVSDDRRIEVGAQHRQQVVEVVGDAAGEDPKRLQTRARFFIGLSFAQGGDVVGERCESANDAVGVGEGHHLTDRGATAQPPFEKAVFLPLRFAGGQGPFEQVQQLDGSNVAGGHADVVVAKADPGARGGVDAFKDDVVVDDAPEHDHVGGALEHVLQTAFTLAHERE